MNTIHLHPSFHSNTVGLCALLAVTAGLCGNHVAHASPEVRANSNDNMFTVNTSERVATSGSVSDAEGATAFNGSTDGRASAAFGVLRAFGSAATVPSNQQSYSYYSFNSASFRDDFLFDSPTLNGTTGSVLMRFTIDGTLALNTSGTPQDPFNAFDSNYAYIEYDFGVDVRTNFSRKKRELLRYDGSREGTPFLGIEQEYLLFFTYGTVLSNVELVLRANVNVQGAQRSPTTYFTNEAVADAEHTATWGGFGDVRDASGNVVTDYTFSSASGTNYTQAVPEPSSLLLLAGGVLLTASRRSRRQAI